MSAEQHANDWASEHDAWEGMNLDNAPTNGAAPTDDSEPDSWQPVDLTDLPDKPPVQPTLGNLGMVYPGKRHVFTGPQESAKTLVAYIIGLEIVRAGCIIVIIDFEMGSYDARDRLKDLGATRSDFKRIRYVEPDEPANPVRIDKLIQLHPALAIIDAAAGAYNLQNLDDNKRGDVETFTVLYVKRFWRASIASLVLDHVVKNTENRGKYAIGSERKVGGADVHLGFEALTPIKRGGIGHYKITTHKDRGGYLKRGKLADLELRSHPDTNAITWELKAADAGAADEPFRPTVLMEKISLYLEPLTVPLSRNEISKQIRGNNEAKATAITRLLHEGYLQDTGTPSASAITSIRKYREDDDAWPTSPTSPDLSPTSPEEQSTSPLLLSPSLRGRGEVEDALSPTDPLPLSAVTDHDDDIPF